MSSSGFKIGRNCNISTRSTSRTAAIIATAALLLGFAASANAEIYAFRQIQDQSNINGVTVNLTDAGVNGSGRHLVDFTFRNIVGSAATKVTDVWFDDRSGNPAGSALVLDTFTITNGPGVDFGTCGSGSIPNGTGLCPTFARNFCANVNGGASNAINQGEFLTLHFTLKAGKTIDDVKFWLLQASTNTVCNGTELPALRIAVSAGLATGGGSSGINNPAPFPPEDCNTNGIPDVCDLDCNGFGGLCQTFVGVCGQGLPPVDPPTNIQANPSTICPGGTSTLTATVEAGQTLEWFSGSCGGQINPIHTGSPFVTDPINQTTTFFARAKNAAGCASNCVQVTVTVGDTQAPVITNCHGPLTATADANCQAAVPDFTPGVTATDNCTTAGNFMITQSPTLGTLVGKGVTNITITVKDQAGNPATCQTTFTVSDTTVPVISTCSQPQSASANGTCQAPVPDFTGGVVATDNCTTTGHFTITQSPTVGTLVGLGPTTVTITVKDESNNQATCQTTFTVNDTSPPVITVCPPSQSASANGSCQAPVPDFTASLEATDNCDSFDTRSLGSVTQSPTAGTLVGIGPHLVTITVKDLANNMSTCQTMFTVNDTTSPMITQCAPPQSASANGSCQAPVPDFTNGVTASDNCTAPGSLVKTQSPTAGTLVGKGDTFVTITVKDQANNMATCQTTFTVNDTTGPTISHCTDPATVFADAECNALVPDLRSMVIATDNCTPAGQLIIDQTPAPGTQLIGLGTTPITITVTDPASGLSDTCQTSVTVVDNMPPAILTCAGPQSVPANQPDCQGLVPDLRNMIAATDNCDFNVTQDPAPGTSVGLGPHDVTLTVTDPANQTDTCHTTVTVVDVTPPEIGSCAPPQSASANGDCEATVPDFTNGVSAIDDCSTVPNLTVTQDPAAGSTVGLGMHVVTITVSDEATPPNTSMCTTTFTVSDTTSPNIVECAANQSASAGETCQAEVPDFTGGSLIVGDNCTPTEGLTITQDPMEGTLVGTGVTVVTVTAQDEAGNTATCTATFTVSDATPPDITCPASTTQPADPDVCGATVNYPPPNVSDNCVDRGACGPVTVDCVPPPGSFFPVGTTPVTCTATDCSGNSASCTFTITVTDGDSDEDGVTNCMDDCPNTPSDQRPVDSVGCSCQQEQLQEEPLDSDDDGVPDACDQCPGTPEGQPVNSDGCACSQINCDDGNPCTLDTCTAGVCSHQVTNTDSDGDGVLDCNDCCPNSPPGAVVDETGCQSIGANAGGPYQRACPDPPGIVTIPLGGIGSGQISSCRFRNGVLSLDWTIDCPGITILNPHTENATLVIDTRITGCPLDCNVTLTATLTAETVEPGQLATFTAQASATAQVALTALEVQPPAAQVVSGACCFTDSSCAIAADAATCSAAGGNFAGVGTDCSTITCKCGKPQGVSLLFSTLSFAPVCGSGCLTMIPLMFIGLLTLRGSRSVRRSKSDRR